MVDSKGNYKFDLGIKGLRAFSWSERKENVICSSPVRNSLKEREIWATKLVWMLHVKHCMLFQKLHRISYSILFQLTCKLICVESARVRYVCCQLSVPLTFKNTKVRDHVNCEMIIMQFVHTPYIYIIRFMVITTKPISGVLVLQPLSWPLELLHMQSFQPWR